MTSNSSKTKSPKSPKPRSFLQRLQWKTNWLLYFCIKAIELSPKEIAPIVTSPTTFKALVKYNAAAYALKECIKRDAANTKKAYKLSRNKKDIDLEK